MSPLLPKGTTPRSLLEVFVHSSRFGLAQVIFQSIQGFSFHGALRLANLRFAFDFGTNSIGWAVYQLGFPSNAVPSSPRVCKLIDCGVRVFADGRNPKDGASLAEMRRVPRSARRRRDRFLQRRTYLMSLLVEHGLMPKLPKERQELSMLDPYALRANGLDTELTPFELGRVLVHLNQRRGFKSNRKTDRGAASDKDGARSRAQCPG